MVRLLRGAGADSATAHEAGRTMVRLQVRRLAQKPIFSHRNKPIVFTPLILAILLGVFENIKQAKRVIVAVQF